MVGGGNISYIFKIRKQRSLRIFNNIYARRCYLDILTSQSLRLGGYSRDQLLQTINIPIRKCSYNNRLIGRY